MILASGIDLEHERDHVDPDRVLEQPVVLLVLPLQELQHPLVPADV
jgi:hypothetical protein